MKRKLKIALSCLMTVCIGLCMFNGIATLTESKTSHSKLADFFEQKEDVDVLFMGTSHVLNGIYPMELWNDYGIVSYNFGGHACLIPTQYWIMKNALDYTEPELIVIDCYALEYETKISYPLDRAHMLLDEFPISENKINAINDLLQDSPDSHKWGFAWDYTIYHNRWEELGQADFENTTSTEKGAESRIGVAVPWRPEKIDSEKKLEEDTVSVQYLGMMIEECQSRGIEVLLTFLPFPASEGSQMCANRVYDIAEEYGVNYLNFLDMDVVDYDTDCFDEGSHLNPSGARKVTDYLGAYITANYDIENQRNNEAYAEWHEDYLEYENYKAENLKAQETLDTYLMLLADKNYDFLLEINSQEILQDEKYVGLLENLGIDVNSMKENTDFIVVHGGGESVT